VKSKRIQSWNNDAPKVVAHRGASFVAPENTMAAFRLAKELEADGIEFDVKLSQDGVPVIHHDMTLERTTNGRGRLKDWTWNDLKELDAGSYFSKRYVGERIPKLSQVLDEFGDSLLLNIELTNYNALYDNLPEVALQCVKEKGLSDTILFSSFNPFALRAIRRRDRNMRLGLLLDPHMPRLARWLVLKLSTYDDIHPHHTQVNFFLDQLGVNHAGFLNVWTVNQFMQIKELVSSGVGGIITDDVETAKQARKVAIISNG
jgi:glycerophosphoryl diester phosphodiesterase